MNNQKKSTKNKKDKLEELSNLLKNSFTELELEFSKLKELKEKDTEIQNHDLRTHISNLHKLWNISETDDNSTPHSLEAEEWYKKLSDLNQTFDIRSLLEELNFSKETSDELIRHYPAYLNNLLGFDPGPINDTLKKLISLRQHLDSELTLLHKTWNIDNQDKINHNSNISKSSARNFIKKLINKVVKLYTDPIFQRQRDFNANTVQLFEKMILEIDEVNRRITKGFIELTNRQFLFNISMVKFINVMIQKMLLGNQRNFNAEVVQTFQSIIKDIPQLVLERTEILINQLHSELEELKNT